MSGPFQILADFDLEEAAKRGSIRNDLLPPRAEDDVGGELSRRFSEGLRDRLQRGSYDPAPASFVYVPKPGHTTRPAALLTLDDRVVYEAIVASLRERIDTSLLSSQYAFWPRGNIEAGKKWREFLHSPVSEDVTHIAISDLTGFYESVDHNRLRDVLIFATGYRDKVNALIAFLRRIMSNDRGLPQGLAPSDQLATAYLSSLDAAMVRAHHFYGRHGDDFRIGELSFAKAQAAVRLLESEARRAGLLLNGSKTVIVRRDTYLDQLEERNTHIKRTRDALFGRAVNELREAGDEVVSALIKKADKDELGWGFFYHQNVTFDELVKELHEYLEPNDVLVAEEVFAEAMNDIGAEQLAPDEFHQRVTFALLQLTAAKSGAAIGKCPELILRYQDKTELVAKYLMSMASCQANEVQDAVSTILFNDTNSMTAWTKAWLFNVLERCHVDSHEELVEYAIRIAEDESEPWISRLNSARFLGKTGNLPQQLCHRLWNLCPKAFRTDIAVAIHSLDADWAQAFRDSLQGDVFTIVSRHIRSQKANPDKTSKKKPRGSKKAVESANSSKKPRPKATKKK